MFSHLYDSDAAASPKKKYYLNGKLCAETASARCLHRHSLAFEINHLVRLHAIVQLPLASLGEEGGREERRV